MARTKKDEFDFEAALDALNKLVEKMEKGGLKLEESLDYFERGIALVRQCQSALTVAEQKVKVLTEKNGHLELTNYQSDDSESS